MRIRKQPAILVPALGLALSVLSTFPAAAQNCTDSTVPGTLIGFTPLPGVIEKPNSCNLLPCYKPEEDGGAYLSVDENCDGLSGPCPIQLRVPLKFPGNSQMPNNAHVRVYWFDQATPDGAACLPPPLGNCSPISICGPLGAEILVDQGETWIQVGASCESIASGQYTGGSFSLSAYACQTFSGECTERLDVPDLVLPSPEEMWDLLECDPPPPPCNQCPCNLGAGSSAGGGPPAFGPPFGGPGARLSYKGRGVGHPGYPGTAEWNTTLGRYWSHDYAQRIVTDPDDQHVWLLTDTGGFHEFGDLQGGVYRHVMPSDEQRRLARTAAGWELTHLDGTVDFFDGVGKWLRSEDRNGNARVASYSGGVLASVSFPDGRSETFTYHVDGKLASITEVGVDGLTSRTWSYTWSGLDLVRMDRPDGTAWTLLYDDPNLPGFITRITLVGTNGSERVEGAWTYDARGNVVRTWRGDESFTSANATDTYSFAYDNPFRPTETQVTDPLGIVTTYEIERDPGGVKPRVRSISGECGSCGLGPESQMFYDDPSHPLHATRIVDARGTVTLLEYNDSGQAISRTEALGTDVERTTSWKYDETYPALVREIEQPSTSGSGVRRLSWTYDSAGNAMLSAEEGVERAEAFRYETVTAYNTAGQVTSVDPPGYGQDDVTRFTYDPARGNLLPTSRTDPLIGVTTFEYDAFNRRIRTVDPNGTAVEQTYDELNRPQQTIQKGATPAQDITTTTVYTPFGEALRTILPEGNEIEYGYDGAGRLIFIERKVDTATHGERTAFTLNRAGQRVREERQRWTGSGWLTEWSRDFIYSSSCHLDKVIDADGSVTEFAYDCKNNLDRVWDANHPSDGQKNPPSALFTYDDLDRFETLSQSWGGAEGGAVVTRYGYDVQDNVVQAVDAQGTETRYVYSDRGLLTQISSEVTGATGYEYNEHGAQVAETDARGVRMERQVDAADRTTLIDYPGEFLDVRRIFDDPAVPYSRGRLTAIVREGERVDYAYDRFGRTIQDGALRFDYDRNGNRQRIDYPNGVGAIYTFDFADRPASLGIDDGKGSSLPVVSTASYRPSGPLAEISLGNGLIEQRGYTQQYFPDSIKVPGLLDWRYSTDAVGNVTGIADALGGGNRVYSYQDYQYYLQSASGPWGALSWTYDRIGNRRSEQRNGELTTYHFAPNKAGLSSPTLIRTETGDGARHYGYDASGDLVLIDEGSSKSRFTYGADRRLSAIRFDESSRSAVTDLRYDGRSFLRSAALSPPPGSSGSGWVTRSTYSTEGVLFYRSFDRPSIPSSPRGVVRTVGEDAVFYFANRPIAQLSRREDTSAGGSTSTTSKLIFLTTDHLGSPVLATSQDGTAVWRGGFEPFGNDFSQAAESGIFLRLPGQWEDETWAQGGPEGGVYYNVHRWFQPGVGSYTRPDPLRLFSALAGYRYGHSNPIRLADRNGLQALPQPLPPPLPPPQVPPPVAPPLRLVPPPPPTCSPSPLLKPLRFAAGAAGAALTVLFEVLFDPPPLGQPGVDDFKDPACNPKCGDCDPYEHGFLQFAVNEACKRPRACKGGMSPELLEEYFWVNVQCMFARQEINNRCYRGGDAGHQEAADNARKAALKCLNFMTAPGQ